MPGGRWRPVINLSSLNHYITAPRFRMESARNLRASILRQVHAVSLGQNYLDNLLLRNQDPSRLAVNRDALLRLSSNLGFVVNL